MLLKSLLVVFSTIFSFNALAGEGERLLNRFLNEVGTYSAQFEQTVLDDQQQVLDQASGSLAIHRPGKFRWDYAPPLEQQIVGDGSKVWIYDMELQQVIARDQERTLGQSPAILLSGSANVADNYDLSEGGEQDGFQWVSIAPRSSETGFEKIRIGFADEKLGIMELVDGLGQTTRIVFNQAAENISLPMEQFVFTPAEGADVIDEQP